MKSIVLFGYRCTGKTQKGKIIAKNLGYDFIDADNLVISKLKSEGYASISDFVKNMGWPEFRKIENQAFLFININCNSSTFLNKFYIR